METVAEASVELSTSDTVTELSAATVSPAAAAVLPVDVEITGASFIFKIVIIYGFSKYNPSPFVVRIRAR
ncbi:hypothetical protein SDC9_154795 [bioreactor metagenome]|uniref:Uncharacterized protein n=1 Tax=bioreactor metagenome TaxID=1076179 RepID=A0A645EZP1_9ZZZZ